MFVRVAAAMFVDPHEHRKCMFLALLTALSVLWKCVCRQPPLVARRTHKAAKAFVPFKQLAGYPRTSDTRDRRVFRCADTLFLLLYGCHLWQLTLITKIGLVEKLCYIVY